METPVENDDEVCGLVLDNLKLNSGLITYYLNYLVSQTLKLLNGDNYNTNLIEFFVQLDEKIHQNSLAQYLPLVHTL